MTTHRIGLAALALGLAVAATLAGAAPAAAPMAKPRYHVYGPGCKGGVKLVASHFSAEEACWNASEARRSEGKGPVFVTCGDADDPVRADGRHVDVYFRSCKVFNRIGTYESAHEAALGARERLEVHRGGDVVFVYHPRPRAER